MESEVAMWLSSIPCGLELRDLAKEFEERGFTTKESMKYVDSSDLDVLFPSPQKLSYAKKKILLKEISKLSQEPTRATVVPRSTSQASATPGTSSSHGASVSAVPNTSNSSFLEKKENSLSEDLGFLEARIASAKHEHARLLQTADHHDELAPKRAKTCTNCHLPGHQKSKCSRPPCSGIENCNIQSKHPEFRNEISELETLIKELEKKNTKAKDDLASFKAAKEKASNSFFAIMRDRLKKSNPMKYAGTDRLILDRDLLTLKKALNNKVPLSTDSDWRLPIIIEGFQRGNLVPLQSLNYQAPVPDYNASQPSSSRRLSYLNM